MAKLLLNATVLLNFACTTTPRTFFPRLDTSSSTSAVARQELYEQHRFLGAWEVGPRDRKLVEWGELQVLGSGARVDDLTQLRDVLGSMTKVHNLIEAYDAARERARFRYLIGASSAITGAAMVLGIRSAQFDADGSAGPFVGAGMVFGLGLAALATGIVFTGLGIAQSVEVAGLKSEIPEAYDHDLRAALALSSTIAGP